MLLSLALIMIIGFGLSGIFTKLRLPGFLGMIITGIVLGPNIMNLISSDILNISKDLREIALIVILTRAGLSIDLKDLKRIGRPAILMSFIPATFELLAVTLIAPPLLHITYIEAAIMGSVLAAVSPAVIVPRMLHLMEGGYGKKNSIPQLIMAGSSIDDIYVIVIFTILLNMYLSGNFNTSALLAIPVSLVTGLFVGVIFGFGLVLLFKRLHIRDTVKVLIIISVAFVFVSLESSLKDIVPFSGLLAVMALGGTILNQYELLAKRLRGKFSKIWVAAEIILFVLVGAAVNVNYIFDVGLVAVLVILLALVFRIVGVNLCLLKTKLNLRERLFCSIAYIPKATVQAAIAAIPLANGVNAGQTILAVGVLAILITAPLGAIGIDLTYQRLLK